MHSVVTKSAEALGRYGNHQKTKYRVGKHVAFHPITHKTKKAHKRLIIVQTELTSPPASAELQHWSSLCSHNYPTRGY